MESILERLRDLHKQATEERSHYYTGRCIRDAIAEIERTHRLRDALEAIAMMRSKDECPLAAEMREIALAALAP